MGARTPDKPKQRGCAAAAQERRARQGLEESIPKPTTLERAAVLQLRCVAITPRHSRWSISRQGDCRYPYGGDAEGEPITFCGHARREGSSYCLSHFHLTILPEGVCAKRASSKTRLRLVEAA